MTPEERIQLRRAEQRRLNQLARLKAERTAWARGRERTEALRKQALEQARAQRVQWTARRETLERQVDRARLNKREEARAARSLATAVEAGRPQWRETQSVPARNEAVARPGTSQRDTRPRRQVRVVRSAAHPRAGRPQILSEHRARRLQRDRNARVVLQAGRERLARRQADQRAERVNWLRKARREALLQEHAAMRAQSVQMRRGARSGLAPEPRQERLQVPRPRALPGRQRRAPVQRQGRQAKRPTQRRAGLRQTRLAEVRVAQREAVRAVERRNAQRTKRVGDVSREAHRAARPSQSPALPPARLASPRRVVALRAPATAARRAVPRPGTSALPALAPSEERETEGLSWLGTSGNLIIDENGEPVLLRGVNVVGLDSAMLEPHQTLGDALALNESALAILTGLWGVNVVRLPFRAETMLEGTDSLPADALLAELDQIIADVAHASAYVLLALQAPVSDGAGAAPDEATHECWQLLAARYQDEPGVLCEIYAASAPLPQGWPDAANRLIGTVRREHPAALIFVSGASAGADVNELPLRFATGEPVHDLVYTVRFVPQMAPASRDPRFRFFTQNFPVVASQWSDSGPDLGRAADLAVQLFERYGIGWIAANWNAAPRLVKNAATRNYAATRFGNAVRRALTLPVRPPVISSPGADWRWPSA